MTKYIRLDWREFLLICSLIFGILVFLVTELLSYFRAIDKTNIAIAWAFIIFIALCIYRLKNFSLGGKDYLESPHLSSQEKTIILMISLIVGILAITALLSPPNTWDSMTYHMSRVMHWIQNQNVDFYQTHIDRQIIHPPWAEYAILNLQLLSESDRYANLVQWASMIGSLIGISLIAKHFGLSSQGQIYTAAFCVSIPMGILQSTSTQTDYVCTFWLICFIYFGLNLVTVNGKLINAIAMGAGLGLAILTKATSYIFAFPFLAWFFWLAITSKNNKKILFLLLSLILTFLINLNHYQRNYQVYGSPLGPGKAGDIVYTNESFEPKLLISNLIRNGALHLGLPSGKYNKMIENAVLNIHEKLGLSVDDKRITWSGTKFRVPRTSFNEDASGNTLHFILITICSLLFFLNRKIISQFKWYLFCILVSALLFCSYLKWQPWHSRLHLPLFVLCAPIIGYIFSEYLPRTFARLIILTLLLISFIWVFANEMKPTFNYQDGIFTSSRNHKYFLANRSLESPYTEITNSLSEKNCHDIGLIIGVNDWEYPFWALLKQKKELTGLKIRHTHVGNESRMLYSQSSPDSEFCSIILSSNNPPKSLTINNRLYLLDRSSHNFSTYIKSTN